MLPQCHEQTQPGPGQRSPAQVPVPFAPPAGMPTARVSLEEQPSLGLSGEKGISLPRVTVTGCRRTGSHSKSDSRQALPHGHHLRGGMGGLQRRSIETASETKAFSHQLAPACGAFAVCRSAFCNSPAAWEPQTALASPPPALRRADTAPRGASWAFATCPRLPQDEESVRKADKELQKCVCQKRTEQLQSGLRSAELVPGLSLSEFFKFSIKTFRMKRLLPRILHSSVMSLQGSSSPISRSGTCSALDTAKHSPCPEGAVGGRALDTNAGSGHPQTFSPRRRKTSIFTNSPSPTREQVPACPQGLGQDTYRRRGSRVCRRLSMMATG